MRQASGGRGGSPLLGLDPQVLAGWDETIDLHTPIED